MTILNEIANYARLRVDKDREKLPLEELRELVKTSSFNREEFVFEKALSGEEMSFICEVKKASPSKGIIDENFDYMGIAQAYEEAGAECISCLTEPKWFLGSDEIFKEIRQSVGTPMIRKDFTVDEYQIYQAKAMGADAVLLICSLLDIKTLENYLGLATDLGLSALVETHDESEIRMATAAGARLIGVNNRNLKDFSVDFSNAKRLRDLIPPNALYVAESGVSCKEDVAELRRIGADAVLMGEVLMRAPDKKKLLDEFRQVAGKSI
ncbi:MAG: indole-3-glycerol phosphate synthase TrpC [Pseudobutyrivibrio sp.]|nr:indole-3-glycerol phosphate synthase TrpC [Pseudobutyrivibrio sp.]